MTFGHLANANNICSYLSLQMVKVTTFGTTIVYVRGRTKTCGREEKNMVEKNSLHSLLYENIANSYIYT
jgi:hypothetical protein